MVKREDRSDVEWSQCANVCLVRKGRKRTLVAERAKSCAEWVRWTRALRLWMVVYAPVWQLLALELYSDSRRVPSVT